MNPFDWFLYVLATFGGLAISCAAFIIVLIVVLYLLNRYVEKRVSS